MGRDLCSDLCSSPAVWGVVYGFYLFKVCSIFLTIFVNSFTLSHMAKSLNVSTITTSE